MTNSKPVERVVPVFNREDLPANWTLAQIGAICVPVQKVNPRDNPNAEFDYIDISGIDNERLRIAETKRYAGRDAPSRARQMVRAGDIVFSTVRTYLKNIARVTAQYDQQIASTGFCVLRPAEPEFGGYLYYYVQYEPFLNELAKFQRGTSYPAVRDGDVFGQLLPVPPKQQAAHIVAEIEKQFSRLDEAVANLKRIRANLKRYKAAVLKAAVEGKLTEDWRKQHPDVEPASKLLERILAERRARWTGRGKYQEPAEPDTSSLPSLPEGWIWAAADQFCDFITKGTTPTAEKLREVTGDVPFLKVYNLTFTGRLDLTIKPTFVDRAVHEGELGRSKVKMGDVLINIVGPPLGQVAIVPDSLAQANINQAIARFRVLEPMSNHYVAVGLMSETIMGWAIKRAKTTAGQSNLTLELCRTLPFPLPPLEEQRTIVSEVERRLSVIEELEAAVEANLKRADRLRQSVLKQAFSGRLTGRETDHARTVALTLH